MSSPSFERRYNAILIRFVVLLMTLIIAYSVHHLLIRYEILQSINFVIDAIVFGIAGASLYELLLNLLTPNKDFEFANLREQYVDLSDRFIKKGLANLLTETDKRFFSKYSNALTIDMFHNIGLGAFRMSDQYILDTIKNNGCSVRIVMTDTGTQFWQSLETESLVAQELLCPGTNIHEELNLLSIELNKLVETLREDNTIFRGRLEVRVYPGLPTCSMIFIDGRTVRFTGYIPHKRSHHAPSYDFTRENNRETFAIFTDSFDHVWNSSTTVLEWRPGQVGSDRKKYWHPKMPKGLDE